LGRWEGEKVGGELAGRGGATLYIRYSPCALCIDLSTFTFYFQPSTFNLFPLAFNLFLLAFNLSFICHSTQSTQSTNQLNKPY